MPCPQYVRTTLMLQWVGVGRRAGGWVRQGTDAEAGSRGGEGMRRGAGLQVCTQA